MTNIIMPNIVAITEERIYRLKDLKQKQKEIAAEIDLLQKHVVDDYLFENGKYINTRGLTLATYLPYTEKRFNSTQFKNDHPDYYDMYSNEKTIYKFLLK